MPKHVDPPSLVIGKRGRTRRSDADGTVAENAAFEAAELPLDRR
jgi:hypothetical protein